MPATSCTPACSMSAEIIKRMDLDKLPTGLNTSTAEIIGHVEINIARQHPQLQTYQPQDREIAIVAGGPSLKSEWGTLAGLVHGANVALCAINGAYGYLLDQGYTASLMCMLDAREWNKRFVDRTEPETKFFLASQCHPHVFDSLEQQGRNIYIWHGPIPAPKGERKKAWADGAKLFRRYYLSDKNYLMVPGGVTCTAKAVMLVYWLGFRKIHMFGFDSCFMDGDHHAYDQPENQDRNVKFRLADRWFECAPWMAYQADSFFKLVPNLPDDINLMVHGDGLIAYGLKRTAEEWDKREIG